MEKKIQQLLARLPVLEAALSAEESLKDRKHYRALTQEHAYLSSLKSNFTTLQDTEKQLSEVQELTKTEKDPAFLALLHEEITQLQKVQTALSKELEELLIPPDPDDSRNVILELCAGT